MLEFSKNYYIYIKTLIMSKIIGTLTVSDNYEKDLFRIHLYEDYIKFDSKFAEGIGNIETLSEQIDEISKNWIEKKYNSSEILKEIVLIIEFYHEDLKDYYFSDDELNEFGKYIDLFPIDSAIMSIGEDTDKYYKYLLRENVLKKIDKKYFEKNIKGESYLDNYLEIYNEIKNKKVEYYQYKLNKNFDFKLCNFVLADEKVFFGYVC